MHPLANRPAASRPRRAGRVPVRPPDFDGFAIRAPKAQSLTCITAHCYCTRRDDGMRVWVFAPFPTESDVVCRDVVCGRPSVRSSHYGSGTNSLLTGSAIFFGRHARWPKKFALQIFSETVLELHIKSQILESSLFCNHSIMVQNLLRRNIFGAH